MFFDIFIISAFFFFIAVFLLLLRDSFFFYKLYYLWFFTLGLLFLPLLWLFLEVGGVLFFDALRSSVFFIFAESGTFFCSDMLGCGAPLWLKSILLACILPLIIFFNQLLAKPNHVKFLAMNAILFIVFVGFIFVTSNQMLIIFFSFELLLLSSLFLLRLTAKSERIGEAVTEMFFWTLGGSVFLFIGFILYLSEGILTLDQIGLSTKPIGVASLMFLLGFGVKLPIWPCFSWLLKAHVEASVEFSILLSGVIVKFGALGIFRFMNQAGFFFNNQILIVCSLLGILEASLRLLGQRDIKRIVALTTVIELNWIGFCIARGGLIFEQVGAYLLVAHSFTTSSEFFLVECLYKRFHTRDFFFISGIANATPVLWVMSLVAILVTIGFPGTSLFTAKLLFFASLASSSLVLFVFFMFFLLLFIPIFFVRLWVPIWFGAQPKQLKFDLSAREISLFTLSLLGSILIGLCPALVID